MMRIAEWMDKCFASGASDLFFHAGKVPSWRIHGEVVSCSQELCAAQEIDSFRAGVLGEIRETLYQKKGSADAGYAIEERRFRLNFFRSETGPGIAVRPLGIVENLTPEALHLPEALLRAVETPRGIVLIGGATGSGKSTTLAMLVEHLNRTSRKHILTIEDPIEYLYKDKQSVITQREISEGVSSFGEAIRSAMRENPDVIVVGEMRDSGTLSAALTAALTGHLVITTLHTANTVQSVDRVVSLFPESLRERAAADLGLSLAAVICQRLVPAAEGTGRIPAVEFLRGTPAVCKAVAERDYRALEDSLARGGETGMIPFSRSLFQLYSSGLVSFEAARNASDNRDQFELLVKGMENGVDAFRDHYGTQSNAELVDMHRLLRTAVRSGASDLHLSAGSPPTLRIDGELREMNLPPLSGSDIQHLIVSVTSPRQQIAFENTRELDFALAVELDLSHGGEEKKLSVCRFRLNAFFQRGTPGMVARVVPSQIPSPEELALPPQLLRLGDKRQGLILVTGPTGSGKSTTLACLLDRINRTRRCHIITIEDPIEYVHERRNALIDQRELHSDTMSFATALKYALRQDPDVILVGEMRDTETMAAALTAAETGHLVLATVHTNSAPQTVDRIIDSFPAGQQSQIRQQFAAVILGVVSQRLLPKRAGEGRAAAFEIMMGTPPVQAMIRDGKTHQLLSAMETGSKDGMVTMDRALQELYEAGQITAAAAQSMRNESKLPNAF